MNFRTFSTVAGLALAAGLSSAHASGYNLGDAANYVVIFQGGGGNHLNMNNPSAIYSHTDGGNIGIAGTGSLQLSGPITINGNVDFAGVVNDNGPYSGNIAVNGVISGGHGNVQTDMNTLNSLSTSLGAEAGASVALNTGATINVSSGTVDAAGNKVFTVSSINAANGNLTINGDGTHKVVFNISAAADANIHFNNIILTGGLTSDDVMFNLFGGNSGTLSGGPGLDLNSNGGTLAGVFLDPYGSVSIVNTILSGRVYGGDSHDEAIVSGATLIAPPSPPTVPDNGSTIILLGLGCLGLVYAGSKLQLRRA